MTKVFKGFLKNFVSKIPIFLFCIIFIQGYTGIFGADNSIVGVVVLTGILIFLKNDFGYNVKQATLCIPLLFVIVSFAPKLSLINPFLGIIINFVSIGLIMILSSHDLSMDNHITFMLGYIFLQGYDVSGNAYFMRVESLLIGSVVIAVIYYLIRRKNVYKRDLKDLFKEMDIHSIRTRWYLKMTITLTVIMFLGDIFDYPRTMWINLTVLSLLQPFITEHMNRRNHRLPATIIGVVLFILVYKFMVPEDYQVVLVLGVGFAAMLANSYFTKTIINAFNALIPAVMLFSTSEAIILRIASNVIGVAVAVIFDYLFNRIFRKLNKQDLKDIYN